MISFTKPRSTSPKPPSRIKKADFERMLMACNSKPKAPESLKARLAEARRLARLPA